MSVLQYTKWQNFEKIIDKAKTSCENSGISAFEHFTDVSKTIKMPKGAEKTILDCKLTRYACYLIAQNGETADDIAKRKGLRYGGTMPEELPTPKKSLKQLEKENKKSLKK